MQDIQCPFTGYHQQDPTVGENKPASRWVENQEKMLEVDGPHIIEIIRLHHEENTDLESWREEKSKIKEYIDSELRGRHEKYE